MFCVSLALKAHTKSLHWEKLNSLHGRGAQAAASPMLWNGSSKAESCWHFWTNSCSRLSLCKSSFHRWFLRPHLLLDNLLRLSDLSTRESLFLPGSVTFCVTCSPHSPLHCCYPCTISTWLHILQCTESPWLIASTLCQRSPREGRQGELALWSLEEREAFAEGTLSTALNSMARAVFI